MTVRKLFEFAQKYNCEDAELQFVDGRYYSIDHINLHVDSSQPEQVKMILSE